jgi:flavin-dependent dehydrogenase
VFDAIVIGGGPAGSTTAARLAQLGRKVVLLEKERFPRFHIGESLLPASVPVFELLGLKAEMDARYLRKNAAEFVTGAGTCHQRYPFAEALAARVGHAYEVDRASFDQLLLECAARHGADVRQEAEVTDFDVGTDEVSVGLRGASGGERLEARVLIDASGQRSMVAGRLGLRKMLPELKNVAVFGHYENAERHSGDREGDITIVLDTNAWWWVIPLATGVTSVGWVSASRNLDGRKPDATFFDEVIASTPYVAKRLAAARRVLPVRAVSDYSYTSQQFTGDRWLLVGDAAAFIDPVFSTGVCLGMQSAVRAAKSVDAALTRGDTRRSAFRDYDRYLRLAVDTYKSFVEAFYRPGFSDILLHPNDRLSMRPAVTALLSGDAVGRRDVAWRVGLIRALGRANAVLPLVPRVVYAR